MSDRSSSFLPLLECKCECHSDSDPCDNCARCDDSRASYSQRSDNFNNYGSPVMACFLMAFSMFLYSCNTIVIREFILEGGTGSGFIFLRSVTSIFVLAYIIYTDPQARGGDTDETRIVTLLGNNSRMNWIMLCGCACGALRQSVLPLAMEGSDASTIGIISPTIPLVTALFAHLLKVEKLTKTTCFCLFLSTLGLTMALDLWDSFGETTFVIYFLLTMIPVTKSLQVIFLRIARDSFNSFVLVKNQIAISIFVCLPGALLFSLFGSGGVASLIETIFNLNLRQVFFILYSTIGIIYFCWKIQIYSLKLLGATSIALFQTLRPLFTMLLGSIFLDEIITPEKIIGSVIICCSLVIYQRQKIAH